MADQRFRELERRAAEDPGDGEAQVRLFGEQIRHGQVDWAVAIAAIAAVPQDDAPRILFANWLESQGDPRGEYIRLQCELAAGPFRSKRRAIANRCKALFKEHRRQWENTLSAKGEWTWRRGFVSSARMSASQLNKHGATVFSREPIDSLGITQCKASLNCLNSKDWLSRLRILKLRGEIVQETLEFLTMQSFPRLKSLNLGDSRLAKIPLAALFQSNSLREIKSLALSGNDLKDQALNGLLNAEQKLESLYLSRNQLTDRALDIIGESPACRSLKRLTLSGNAGLTDKGLERFLESDGAHSMKWLDLEGVKLDDKLVNELRVRIQSVRF